MKKENVYKFLYAIAVLMIVGFAIRFGVDCFKYDTVNNSAPLYLFAVERAVEFILPSIILFIVGRVMKKKYSN